jgi:transposase-like protein
VPKVGKWRKYSPEFREKALQRIEAGENVSALARELGVRRKFFYVWKAAKRECAGGVSVPRTAASPEAGELAKQKKRIAELERLAGQQAAELDFFAAALRSIEGSGPKSGSDSGDGSTRRSKL